MHKPRLLILDEATSALDPKSEAAVCETLQHMRGELTILVISHQPALVKISDLTYQIEQGKIVSTENDVVDLPCDVDTATIRLSKQQRI